MTTVSNSGMLIYLIADVSCIFLLLPVLHHIKTSIGSEAEILTFRSMIWAFFVYVLADLVMIFFMDEQSPFPIWVCNAVTIIDELSLLCVGYFWFWFGAARLSFKYQEERWFRILVSIPFTAVLILSVTSPMTGYLFHIAAEGTYMRGPLFSVQAAVVIMYNLSIPIMSVFAILRTRSAADKNKAFSLIKFVIAPLATGIVQVINPNTPIMCLGLVIGIYYVYIDTVNMQIYNDSMTGMNNRRRAEYFLTDCIGSASPERPFYLFMIDVDYFKGINDKYGHVEGDHALRIVAEALKMTADQNSGFAARMGGDEFLLCTFNHAVKDPEKIGQVLNANLYKICENNRLPYRLSLSVGYTECNSSKSKLVSLINEADKMLYVNKNAYHASSDHEQ